MLVFSIVKEKESFCNFLQRESYLYYKDTFKDKFSPIDCNVNFKIK